MYPSCNQLAKIYGAAKTHKFNNITEININDLKFRPIIDQTYHVYLSCSQRNFQLP